MNKIKAGIIVGTITLGLGLIGYTNYSNAESDKFTAIDFPKLGAELPHHINFDLDSNAIYSEEKIKPGKKGSSDFVYSLPKYKT